MTTIDDLSTPALIVDLDKLETNIQRMAERARTHGVRLRPHIKTHKCVEIAQMQVEAGCNGLTVSTLHEAAVFAENGFDDLTWAFPLILTRLDEARSLSERCRLGIVIDSIEALEAIEGDGGSYRVWLKVDCGYHRAGVDPGTELSFELANRITESSKLGFQGILTHSGHAYNAADSEQVQEIAEQERAVMTEFAQQLRERGIEVPAVSVGSTPAMSVVESLEGVDEIRPGNYVFYDFTQVELGSCSVSDCAVTVLASVVSSPGDSDRSIIDAGALALSKDVGPARDSGVDMGRIFADYASGQLSDNQHLYALSQEHGHLSGRLPVGSLLRVLPNHSCLTVASFDEYHVVRGNEVVDRWRIWRGR